MQAFSKSDLAQSYNPQVSPQRALHILSEWINHHPTLPQQLHATGYHKSQKLLTPLQVHLIFQALGEP